MNKIDVITLISSKKGCLSKKCWHKKCKGKLRSFIDDDAVAKVDWIERLAAKCEDPQGSGSWRHC